MVQTPEDSTGQVLGITLPGEVSIDLMVDHVSISTDVESDNRGTAGHTLHNRTRKVLRQGRNNHYLSHIIQRHQFIRIAYESDIVNRDALRNSLQRFIRAKYDQFEQIPFPCIRENAQGRQKQMKAFSLVGNSTYGAKKDKWFPATLQETMPLG